MRNLVLPILLVAALSASSAAMAAGYSTGGTMAAPAAPTAHTVAAPVHLKLTRGTIKALDAKACTVTLASKHVYEFGPKCDFSKLKVGEKVTIKWAPKGKMRDAMSIASR
ncbi:DUF1344 domain-containing protein [Devosia sp. A16]|uniref:DUF1344 domain-containing protein n=1 Tax=Devosia sp. A16 TaxID=1736675 RepID=UPI0006D846B1|nr:DUF1344 domain-containing protein [Devosia sp. A16]